jgi:hypothetical protein
MASGFVLVRFWHPIRDLTFLSSLLSMPCFRSWTAGSSRETPLGEPLNGTYSDSYWASQLEFPGEAGFREKLVFAIDRLTRVKKNIHDFKSSGGKIEIYLQLSGSINNGDTIESALIKTMGELGVDLLIEVFPDA